MLLLQLIGVLPLAATTFTSKFTMRSPEMFADVLPIPCAVWQVEQENPSSICRACSVKLLLLTI